MFKSFNNLRIGVRIIIGFFIIVAIACIIGVVGIQNLKNVQDSYALDYESTVDALEYVERISSHFQQIRVNVLVLHCLTTQMKKGSIILKGLQNI